LALLQELQLSSGRGCLHVHVSSHWPREETKLVKVAFKTGDTVRLILHERSKRGI